MLKIDQENGVSIVNSMSLKILELHIHATNVQKTIHLCEFSLEQTSFELTSNRITYYRCSNFASQTFPVTMTAAASRRSSV